MIRAYLAGRATLKRVFLLIDARHGLMATDEPLMDELDRAGVSYQIVLTKTDKVKPSELAARESRDRRGDPQASGGASGDHRHILGERRRSRRAPRRDRCLLIVAISR